MFLNYKTWFDNGLIYIYIDICECPDQFTSYNIWCQETYKNYFDNDFIFHFKIILKEPDIWFLNFKFWLRTILIWSILTLLNKFTRKMQNCAREARAETIMAHVFAKFKPIFF